MILQSLFRQWVVCEQTFVIVLEMESCIPHKGSRTKVVLHWFIYLPTAITRRALILRYAALIPNIRRQISKEKLAAWKVAILLPEQLPCIKVKIFEMLRQCSSLLLSRGGLCHALCTFLLLTLLSFFICSLYESVQLYQQKMSSSQLS